MKEATPRISRTENSSAFLIKYWFAFLLFLSAIILGGRDIFVYPARIPLVAALAVAGLFCLTAAEVRAEDRTLRFRRFLVWRSIPYDQIRECRNSLIPGFGYARLANFSRPWVKFYFVTARSAFSGDPRELVAYINARRIGDPVSEAESANDLTRESERGQFYCALAALVGVLYAILVQLFFPNYFQPVSSSGFSGWQALLMTSWQRAMDWPWSVGTILFLTLIVLWMRFRNRAWILAWACGTLVGGLATKLVQYILVR
jgi:hypothetical protein